MANLSDLIAQDYKSKTDDELLEIRRGMKNYIDRHQFTQVEMCRKYQECIEEITNEMNRRAYEAWRK